MGLAYAWRALRQNPLFTVTAVATLALGIGGNTAMFTVVRAVLLKPLDYPNPDELVNISGGATPTRYEDLKASARSFDGMGAFSGQENLTLTGGTEPEVLHGARVSANFLTILGSKPVLGRSFQPDEDSQNGPPVVMISEGLWNRGFHRDPGVTGKTIVLSETAYSIVGVMPARFAFPFPGLDAWITRPYEWPLMSAGSRRLSPFLSLFGRLKPGITLDQASAEIAIARHRYALQHPAMLDAKAKSPREVELMKDDLVTDIRTMLWMLLGAVGFVLLITCANVAGLMLARTRSRAREFAIRAAIGASRQQLVSHLLAESLLLSIAGGILGIFLAVVCLRAIPRLTSFDLPRTGEIHLDWVVLLFAAGLSIGTGLLFGMTPSLHASRPDLISVLRGTGVAASEGGKFNPRAVLVVAQVAFSMVLLIGAALMIESLIHLRDVNVGFNPAGLITAQINLPPLRYDTPQKRASFFEELTGRIDASPGVRSAAAAMTLPMGLFAGSPVQDAAQPRLRLNERPIATICVVTPGYFRTLGIPIRRGRDFTFQDQDGAERVAIIDEAFARRFWPQFPAGLDPIGQRLFVGGVNPNPARIVGVVPAVHQNLENTAWPETVYISFAQGPQATSMLAVRTQRDPLRYAATLRSVLHSLDRDLALSDVHSMDELIDEGLGQRQLVVGLLGSFAGVSLLLALIGIYGTISYAVTQRVQELAIRSALGAQKHDILGLVLRQGFLVALAGIALGTVGCFWLTKSLSHLLFGVSATDPATFVGMGILFGAAALIASYLPALRATRIDPATALRV